MCKDIKSWRNKEVICIKLPQKISSHKEKKYIFAPH